MSPASRAGVQSGPFHSAQQTPCETPLNPSSSSSLLPCALGVGEERSGEEVGGICGARTASGANAPGRDRHIKHTVSTTRSRDEQHAPKSAYKTEGSAPLLSFFCLFFLSEGRRGGRQALLFADVSGGKDVGCVIICFFPPLPSSPPLPLP